MKDLTPLLRKSMEVGHIKKDTCIQCLAFERYYKRDDQDLTFAKFFQYCEAILKASEPPEKDLWTILATCEKHNNPWKTMAAFSYLQGYLVGHISGQKYILDRLEPMIVH